MSHNVEDRLRDNNIPVIPSKNLKIEYIEGYPYVRTNDLERIINEIIKLEKLSSDKILEEIAKEYKIERKKEMEEST